MSPDDRPTTLDIALMQQFAASSHRHVVDTLDRAAWFAETGQRWTGIWSAPEIVAAYQRESAARYADARQALIEHITSGEPACFPYGELGAGYGSSVWDKTPARALTRRESLARAFTIVLAIVPVLAIIASILFNSPLPAMFGFGLSLAGLASLRLIGRILP